MATDVIVVGAGPAGASAAQSIALVGYKVLLLEKSLSPGKNKGCGGALSKKCFTSLKLPEEVVEKECSQFVVHLGDEELRVPSKPGFVVFDREIFDRLLAQRAVESGAQLLASTLVRDVVRRDDWLAVHYENLPESKMYEAKARIVVFADGASTLAYKKFQIGFDRRSDGTALAAACDLKYPKNELDSLDFFFSEDISPFGYGWIFPKKDTVNVGVACLLSKMKHDIQTYLDSFVSSTALRSREIVGHTSRLMPQFAAEKLHSDSILVVGDAAGTADPIDGGGIFNAIVSGQVAGKVAVEALEAGDLTADFLSRYEAAWRKTENYRLFQRSHLLQRLALKVDVNIGVFLRQIGFFERYASAE